MSVKWMSYIWEERTDLKGSELYCAIAIADHSDADGKCFPGIATIAQKMRLKERQVQDLIKRLEAKNVFDVERGDGRGNLTAFKFKRVQDSASFEEIERVQDSAIKGAGFRAERVQDSASPLYKEESFKEPLINRVKTHTPAQEKNVEAEAHHALPTSLTPNENSLAARHGFPLDPLYEAFPEINLLPAQIGLIQADVKEADREAWLSTIKIYQANHNPALKRYLPDKVGNLLSVFNSEKEKFEQKESKNGQFKTTTEKRSETAVRDFNFAEQNRARVEARRNR